MPHYEIKLPEGLTLLVEITHNPVHFKIVFPEGKAVNFGFDPGIHPGSAIVVEPPLHHGHEPIAPGGAGTRSVVSASPGTAATITFGDANADGGRPMVP